MRVAPIQASGRRTGESGCCLGLSKIGTYARLRQRLKPHSSRAVTARLKVVLFPKSCFLAARQQFAPFPKSLSKERLIAALKRCATQNLPARNRRGMGRDSECWWRLRNLAAGQSRTIELGSIPSRSLRFAGPFDL